MQPFPTHLMVARDVAELLGLSMSGLYKLDGELQPVRLPNKQRRYDPRAVQDLLVKRGRR